MNGVRLWIGLLWWAAVCSASGAANAVEVPKLPLDASRQGTIGEIAILVTPEPKHVSVQNQGGAAAVFGVIGGLAQASGNVEHTKLFVDALNAKPFKLGPDFTDKLKSALQRTGFNVSVIQDWPQRTPGVKGDEGDSFAHIQTSADAILCVWFGVTGYVSSPFSTQYEPWVTMRAKLMDGASRTMVYTQSFSAGPKNKFSSDRWDFQPLDDSHNLANFEALMSDLDRSVDGLKAGYDKIAERLASQLAFAAKPSSGAGSQATDLAPTPPSKEAAPPAPAASAQAGAEITR